MCPTDMANVSSFDGELSSAKTEAPGLLPQSTGISKARFLLLICTPIQLNSPFIYFLSLKFVEERKHPGSVPLGNEVYS